MPGDGLIPQPDVVLDRGFTLDASPEQVWPWFAQLGKNRAGWYLPTWIEALLPRGRLEISWAIRLTDDGPGATRVHLRFRLSGARRPRLVEYGGGLVDLLTVAGLAAGLRERLRPA